MRNHPSTQCEKRRGQTQSTSALTLCFVTSKMAAWNRFTHASTGRHAACVSEGSTNKLRTTRRGSQHGGQIYVASAQRGYSRKCAPHIQRSPSIKHRTGSGGERPARQKPAGNPPHGVAGGVLWASRVVPAVLCCAGRNNRNGHCGSDAFGSHALRFVAGVRERCGRDTWRAPSQQCYCSAAPLVVPAHAGRDV